MVTTQICNSWWWNNCQGVTSTPDKNTLHNQQSTQSIEEYTTEYKIDKKVCMTSWIRSTKTLTCIHILNSVSPRGMAEGHFMLSIRGGLTQTMPTDSIRSQDGAADIKYDGEKKAWNWEKYVAWHVKYYIILGNLMEYGYQGLDPGSKFVTCWPESGVTSCP